MKHIAYLQHGRGTQGPFCTERVQLKHEGNDRYKVLFERRWRRVYGSGRSRYINFQGERIALDLEALP